MRHSRLALQVIDVICYSRLISKELSPGECISLHQWANLGIEPGLELKAKFDKISKEIKLNRWEKPEIKYDDNFYQYYLDANTFKWVKLKEK